MHAMAVLAQPYVSDALTFFADRFGIDAPLCHEVLRTALLHGGDHADLYAQHGQSRSLVLEDGIVRGGTAVDAGVGVRVVRGEAVGYASTERFDREALLAAARTASEITVAGGKPPATAAPLQLLSAPDYYPVATFSLDEPPPAAVDLLRRADVAARAVAPSIAYVRASLREEVKRIAVASSDGRLVGDTQPIVHLPVLAVSVRDGDRQQGYEAKAARAGFDVFSAPGWTPEAIGQRAAERAVLGHEAVAAPAGFLPVVLAAGDSGVFLHEAVGHGLEADFIRKRLSTFTGRIGEQVASPLCTVVDDGTQRGRYGSINIDDEGEPSRENVLIEDGVLRGYLHDRISSLFFDASPTGSGRRESFRHVPMPRMTTTFLRNGETPPEEIVRAVKHGIYCVSFAGGQVDIANGDFVFSTMEAYLIEDGKVTAPLRDTNLIGNGPDSMTRVTMVGNDLAIDETGGFCGKDGQWVPVNDGVPTILIDGITVGGTRA
jgi:TldD protein